MASRSHALVLRKDGASAWDILISLSVYTPVIGATIEALRDLIAKRYHHRWPSPQLLTPTEQKSWAQREDMSKKLGSGSDWDFGLGLEFRIGILGSVSNRKEIVEGLDKERTCPRVVHIVGLRLAFLR